VRAGPSVGGAGGGRDLAAGGKERGEGRARESRGRGGREEEGEKKREEGGEEQSRAGGRRVRFPREGEGGKREEEATRCATWRALGDVFAFAAPACVSIAATTTPVSGGETDRITSLSRRDGRRTRCEAFAWKTGLHEYTKAWQTARDQQSTDTTQIQHTRCFSFTTDPRNEKENDGRHLWPPVNSYGYFVSDASWKPWNQRLLIATERAQTVQTWHDRQFRSAAKTDLVKNQSF
jgi:hypothetical protein